MVIAEKMTYINETPSFQTLAAYLTQTPAEENRILCGKIYNCGNLDGEFGKNDLDRLYKAADIMKHVASTNNRIIKSPLIHYSISFHPSDRNKLSRSDMLDSCDYIVEQSKMHDCQCICCFHDDKHHLHFHIMLNRVKPADTTVYEEWGDLRDLEKKMRALENNYGLVICEGNNYTFNGKDKRDLDEETMQRELFEALLERSLSKNFLLFGDNERIKTCRDVPILNIKHIPEITQRLSLEIIRAIAEKMSFNLKTKAFTQMETDLIEKSLKQVREMKISKIENLIKQDYTDLYKSSPNLALPHLLASWDLSDQKDQAKLYTNMINHIHKTSATNQNNSELEKAFFTALTKMAKAIQGKATKDELKAKVDLYDICLKMLEKVAEISKGIIKLRILKIPSVKQTYKQIVDLKHKNQTLLDLTLQQEAANKAPVKTKKKHKDRSIEM